MSLTIRDYLVKLRRNSQIYPSGHDLPPDLPEIPPQEGQVIISCYDLYIKHGLQQIKGMARSPPRGLGKKTAVTINDDL